MITLFHHWHFHSHSHRMRATISRFRDGLWNTLREEVCNPRCPSDSVRYLAFPSNTRWHPVSNTMQKCNLDSNVYQWIFYIGRPLNFQRVNYFSINIYRITESGGTVQHRFTYTFFDHPGSNFRLNICYALWTGPRQYLL